MQFYVYQLRASDEEQPFYVGKTFEGSNRLNEHHYDASDAKKISNNRMKSNKIRSVLRRGAEIVEEIIGTFVCEQEAFSEEIRLIALYGRRDTKTGFLCNHTDGGEGICGVEITDATRKKMSVAKLGNTINVGRNRPDVKEKWQKDVTVFDLSGNVLYSCESARVAETKTGIKFGLISNCCVGICNTAKNANGEVFRFKLGIIDEAIAEIVHRQHKGLGKVHQFTKENVFIREYRTSSVAEKETGISGGRIRMCMRGTAKTAGGFVWRFAEIDTDAKDASV